MDDIKEKIKNKIIDLVSTEAGGRLIIFKPENSSVDLVVEKKGDYKNKVISLKVFSKEFLDSEEIKKEINPDPNFYLIFANFNFVKQNIEDEIIIVSTADFKNILMNKNDFGKFLIEKLDTK